MKKYDVDAISTVDEYIDKSDWRVDANANQDYSLGGMILNSSGKVTANYWLEKHFSEEANKAHRSGDLHIHDLDMLSGYCFTGDTKLELLDGTTPTFEELYKEGRTENLELFAYDEEKGDVVPAIGKDLRITRWEKEVAVVTLDNGKTVRCTTDHKWMLRDGSYKEARLLEKGDSLMPLYLGKIGSGYKSIRHNSTEGRTKSYVHRWYMEHILGRSLSKDEVVHHIDGRKDNNSKDNLTAMDDKKHRAKEVRKTMKTKAWKKANNERLVSYNKSQEKRKQISDFAQTRERELDGTFANHKVKSVSFESFEKAVPMYDLEVPTYHNFALEAGVFVHNCAGWSLRTLLEEGFNGVEGAIASRPPKHFSSAVGQITNFLGTLQNEWAGAQAFSSFDTYMAPFVRLDNLSYDEVKQNLQELVFNLNVPSRWGNQSPFTNLTFDWNCPDDLKDEHPYIGGEEVDFTYGDLKEEMDVINRAFIDVMSEGDANGRAFTFPIPTYNITKDFDWDSENSKALFEMTAKYGLPYFQNFINSDLDPGQIRSMCPLTADTEVIVKSSENGVRKTNISTVVRGMERKGTKYEVWTPNGWKDAKPVRAVPSDSYTFLFSNGLETSMGENHLQPVRDKGTVKASEIEVGDWIPFAKEDDTLAELITYSDGEIQSDEDYNYYRVEKIVNNGYEENLYCFEVDDPSHLFTLANGMVTHNCRLQLDLTELLKRGNGLFGSAELTGSIGVVTINLARLGYRFKNDKEALIKELDRLINISAGVLEERRAVVQELIDKGLYPYTKRYLGSLNNHFSTIGVNGMNELVRNYTDDEFDITDEYGHELSVEILDHIRDRMVELQEATGNMYNLEATPAEGTTYRFAKEDKAVYPDILQAGSEEQPYYTNSSQLPVGYTDDPFLALAEQDELQKKYTGGTVLHLYMGERVSSGHAAAQLVKKALTNFELPYLTITPTFSVCPVHGYLDGKQEYCSKCASVGKEQKCEVWERVMGYLRPVSSFNIGKKGEHAERLSFKEPEISPIN